jgi:hypothetical protein
MDFAEGGRHLIINGVVTTVYRNTILSKASTVSRFAAKYVDDKTFTTNVDSPMPVSTSHGGRHMSVAPFAMEDGGGIGAHGHTTLRMLAEYAVAKGRLPPRPARAPPRLLLEAVAMWVCMWQQRL